MIVDHFPTEIYDKIARLKKRETNINIIKIKWWNVPQELDAKNVPWKLDAKNVLKKSSSFVKFNIMF